MSEAKDTPSTFRLADGSGVEVLLTDVGASIVECRVPAADGSVENVCLRLPNVEDYWENPSNYGAVVGRYANRIGRGRFTLDGRDYELEINNGPNHLHGASSNFARRLWDAEPAGETAVTFRLTSPDGDGGYPGRLEAVVRYELADATLSVGYEATCDAPTVINLTNHAYWNLNGHDAGPATDHEVRIAASRVCVNDADVLPTGELRDVSGTPFDFRSLRPIATDWDEQPGYDNCFLLDNQPLGSEPADAAELFSAASGRRLRVRTTCPGVQLYTANHLDGSDPNAYRQHAAVCLEAQDLPDAPNQSAFPSVILRPGETYRRRTEHEFSWA